MIQPTHPIGADTPSGTEPSSTIPRSASESICSAADLLETVTSKTVLQTSHGEVIGYFVPVEKLVPTTNPEIDALNEEIWAEIAQCDGDLTKIEAVEPDDCQVHLAKKLRSDKYCGAEHRCDR